MFCLIYYTINHLSAPSLFLDKFLELTDYPILLDSGKVSALEAKLKAHEEYENYRIKQDRKYLSDFDKLLLEIEHNEKRGI